MPKEAWWGFTTLIAFCFISLWAMINIVVACLFIPIIAIYLYLIIKNV